MMSHQRKRFVLQVKGDFDALLNADSSKPATTKQPPVLLDLRKSGSFKPQSSVDSAASFATAPSSSSDVVSEAAGPTHSSRPLSTTSAGDSSPLKAGPPAAHTSAGEHLLQKPSSNGTAESAEDAKASPAGCKDCSPKPMNAAQGEHHDSSGPGDVHSAEDKRASKETTLNGSISDLHSTGAHGEPPGLQRGHLAISSSGQGGHASDLGEQLPATDGRSPAQTCSMPEQESSMQATQAQQGVDVDEKREGQNTAVALLSSSSLSTPMQASESWGSASAQNSHPLESLTPDSLVNTPKPTGGLKQDAEGSSATLHDPLLSSGRGAPKSDAVEVLEPSSNAAASQEQLMTSRSRTSALHDSRGDAGLQISSGEAGHQQSTMLPEQANSAALRERSDSAQQQASAVPGSGHSDEAPAQAHTAEPEERSAHARWQLSLNRGPEPSEELPVSTLGARCLSGVLPGSLPDPEGSAAGDSPAACARAPRRSEGASEPDVDHTPAQQGTVRLPHGYKRVASRSKTMKSTANK